MSHSPWQLLVQAWGYDPILADETYRLNLREHFLEKFSLIMMMWNAGEDMTVFFVSGCCWVVLQSQGAKSPLTFTWPPLSFISVVSFLPNSDPTPTSCSLVGDPVLEGSLGWSVLRAHGVCTTPSPSRSPLHSPTNGLEAPHFSVSTCWWCWDLPIIKSVHHLMTSLCFFTQSYRHHADLVA